MKFLSNQQSLAQEQIADKQNKSTQQRQELYQTLQNSQSNVINLNKQRFSQLLKKINQFIQNIQSNNKYSTYYKSIYLSSSLIIQGLKTIYQYFKLLGEQINNGIVRKQIGNRLVQYVHEYLELEKYQQLDTKNKAVYILQFQTKFSFCLQFFQTIKFQQSNITNSSENMFKHVWKNIQKVSVGDRQVIQKKYNFVKKMMIITTTAILTQQKFQWAMIKKVFFGLAYPRYMVDYATARLKSFQFYKTPTIKMAKQIWNIPEFGATSQFIKIAFQNIVFNHKIYIPFQSKQDQFPDIHTYSQNAIQVRILNHQELHFKKKNKKSSIFTCCISQQNGDDYKQIDTIIVHMHGGGFIALSSRMMQTMTRRWANKLKIPIFSIDYRKPPSHPFPAAPNDCLDVYKFIITKIHKYMNITPKNIYLVGDSAGGNLACSLMGSILKQNLLIPKGIYLAYPAVDLRVLFSPSRIHAVTDPLLWPSMLLLCLNEYLNGRLQYSLDPRASPILLTQQYVGGDQGDKRFPLKWPKTMIVVGEKDPLYDDSLMLMQKMTQSNVQCKCRVYKEFSHGFLSTNFMISQCEQTLIDSIQDLRELTGIMDKKKPKSQIKKIKEEK